MKYEIIRLPKGLAVTEAGRPGALPDIPEVIGTFEHFYHADVFRSAMQKFDDAMKEATKNL